MSEPPPPSLVESEPKWPLAIAGASIATGAITLLPGCYSLVESVARMWNILQKHGLLLEVWTAMLPGMAVPLLMLLPGSLLLWAGLWCWKRKRHAAGLHIIWAIINIGLACAVVVGMYLLSLSDVLRRHGVGGLFPLNMVISMSLGFGYPIFILVWFLRKKVRREVARWRLRHRNQTDGLQSSRWPCAIAGASIALAASSLPGICYSIACLPEMTGPYKALVVALTISWAPLYGLLLWAGVACWKHKRRTVGMHIGFAIGCIAMSLGSPFLIPETWHVNILKLAWGAGVAALGLTYQVFLLVWFTRSKVRQTIAGWDEPSATAGGNLASP